MSEILLCNRPLNAQALQNHCGINLDQLSALSCEAPALATPNTPYLIDDDHAGAGRGVLGQLAPAHVARNLTNLSLSFGSDNVVALAEINAGLKEYNIGMMGASTSVYAHRIGGFAGAVKNYQAALMEYRHAVKARSPKRAAFKQTAHAAFKKMQSQFRNELKVVNARVRARRGTPLTSAERATNIARSSRNAAKLNVTSQIQANNLVKLSRQAKFLGNGLAVIDFGSRVGNIHNSYQAGGNWERDLFIESSSFALSAGSGVLAVNAGTAALGILMVATPIGWVGLIVGGLAVAGTAAAVSMGTNAYTKEKSGGVYDGIMNWMSTL
ncbi:hypothetical protein [Marinobacter caseinilyticus]|uniref:hypothetical protein n=1 Tax=Marinobacter caseinilyticus TaxID=2692195 RepID=UPI00140CA086|nr:hypothetical protein [Marinobacter caseinilyticus]